MKFLKLIGFNNLIILVFAQLIFKYGLLDQQPGLILTLSDGNYFLLVLASALIAAGGFLISNIMANGSSTYGLSESAAYYIYGGCTLGGLIIGYYLADVIGRTSFLMAFAIPIATLYFYATNLRQSMVLGNLAISFVAALSVMAIGIFALYPLYPTGDSVRLTTLFSLLKDYAIFTFVVTMITTLLFDLKNTDADYNAGLNTLPVSIGRERTCKIVAGLCIILGLGILYYINTYLKDLLWAMGYILLFMLGPIVYILINVWSAKTKKEFATLELLSRAVLVFAAISSVVITYNIQNHA